MAERLRLAKQKAEEGELDEAWKLVRYALERLYTVVYKKYGSTEFNPLSWIDQPAEYMWDNGAGEIVEGKVPGSGRRLKEILTMTAGGAHDKPTQGLTDLHNAISFIRPLLPSLRVGAG